MNVRPAESFNFLKLTLHHGSLKLCVCDLSSCSDSYRRTRSCQTVAKSLVFYSESLRLKLFRSLDVLQNCLLYHFSRRLYFANLIFEVKHLLTFFEVVFVKVELKQSPQMRRKRVLLNSELISFVECFEEVISLKLIHKRPSKRSVFLSRHL